VPLIQRVQWKSALPCLYEEGICFCWSSWSCFVY